LLGIDKAFSWLADYRAQVEIDAPSQSVFDYLLDLNHHDQFVGGEVTASTFEPPEIGSGFTAEVSAGEAGKVDRAYVVTELVEGRRLVYATVGEPADVHAFELTSTGSDTTRIEHRFKNRPLGLVIQIFFLLVLPISIAMIFVGAMTYRPFIAWSARQKLLGLPAAIETMRSCVSCGSAYRVAFHVQDGEDVWICGKCASNPEHIEACTYCRGSARERIEF